VEGTKGGPHEDGGDGDDGLIIKKGLRLEAERTNGGGEIKKMVLSLAWFRCQMWPETHPGGAKRGRQGGMFHTKQVVLGSFVFVRRDGRFFVRVEAYRGKFGVRKKGGIMIALRMVTDDEGSTGKRKIRYCFEKEAKKKKSLWLTKGVICSAEFRAS
jgi:hypothetical protein